MYSLTLTHKFDSAHRLRDYEGPCANIHGHTWRVKIKIKVDELVKDMVIDFKDLKNAIDKRFDHKFINDQVNYNPTAENISKDIYNMVRKLYFRKEEKGEDKIMPIIAVTVWESDNASITYSE